MMKFSEKVVLYRSGVLTLAGVVMLPEGGPNPGAVFVHGSGNSDRTNLWYQEIAQYLASHGIAILLPDKRGCHESEGNWRKSDFHDLAEDAIAGINALRAQKNVDPKWIGLIGVSQGGWIAPIAAHMGNVAFVVSISGTTVTPHEQFRHEVTQDIRQKGLPSALSYIYFPIAQLLLRQMWPKWQDVKDFDPMPLWETLPVPGLIVFGDEDEYDNVPVQESVRRLNAVIPRNPRADLTVKVFQGSDHAWTPGARNKTHSARLSQPSHEMDHCHEIARKTQNSFAQAAISFATRKPPWNITAPKNILHIKKMLRHMRAPMILSLWK